MNRYFGGPCAPFDLALALTLAAPPVSAQLGVPLDSAGGFEDAGMAHVFFSQGLFRDGFETGNAGHWSEFDAD